MKEKELNEKELNEVTGGGNGTILINLPNADILPPSIISNIEKELNDAIHPAEPISSEPNMNKLDSLYSKTN